MIGHSDVLITVVACRDRHFLNRIRAITGSGVCVQFAANIFGTNEAWNVAPRRLHNFIATLAKLRRNKTQADVMIQTALGGESFSGSADLPIRTVSLKLLYMSL